LTVSNTAHGSKSDFANFGDEVIVVGLDAFGLIVGKPESPSEQE